MKKSIGLRVDDKVYKYFKASAALTGLSAETILELVMLQYIKENNATAFLKMVEEKGDE